MPNVVFVAPFLMEATLRFVEATADLPGVRLALVSQDSRIPPHIASKLAKHEVVPDALDAQRIADGVRRISKEIGPAGRLLGALEELQVPLGEVRDLLGIRGLGADAARNFRDKSRMKDVLSAAGVPCARHRPVSRVEDALAFADEVGFPVIVKPTAGSGSRNTFRVEDDARLREVFSWEKPSERRPTMLEEFIVGDEFSFDSVFLDGRIVWSSINHYDPSPLEVLEKPWIQWCVLLPREVDRPEYGNIRDVAQRALMALGMQPGLSHMEWFRRRDGSIAISEVGARPPGAQFTTLISYAHDTDFYRAWARLMVYDDFTPPPRPYAAGAAFLRAQGKGRIQAIHGLEEVRQALGGVMMEAKVPRRGEAPTGTYDGDGHVIVRHPDTELVKKALSMIVSTIRVELG